MKKNSLTTNKLGSIVRTDGVTGNAWQHFKIKHLWKVDLFKKISIQTDQTEPKISPSPFYSIQVVADSPKEAMLTAIKCQKRDKKLLKKYYDENLRKREEADEEIEEGNSIASER